MLFEILKKHWLKYLIDIILAIVIININLNLFFVYVYIIFIFKIDINTDYLRKLMRVFHISGGVDIHAIIKKMKITDDEIEKVRESVMNGLNKEQLESLEKDIKDLSEN